MGKDTKKPKPTRVPTKGALEIAVYREKAKPKPTPKPTSGKPTTKGK